MSTVGITGIFSQLQALWDKFTAPHSADDKDARREYATKVILGIFTLILAVATPFFVLARILAFGEVTLDMPIAVAVLSIISAASWRLAYQGHWRFASYIPPAMMFLLAMYSTCVYDLGVTNIMMYTLAILLTVLLQSEKIGWGVLALCFGMGLAIIRAQVLNSRPFMGVRVQMDKLIYWLVSIGSFYTVVILLLRFLVNQYRQELARSRDLTAELEEEIVEHRRAREALQESEKKYRLLAENTLDCIWRTDIDLVFTYANPAIYRITGYTPSEWQGSNWSEHCDTENYKKVMLHVREAIAGSLDEEGVTFEATMLKKSGAPVLVEITGRALLDESGRLTGFQGIARDITDRRHMEERLQRQEQLAAVGQLAAGIAHDFRNLLATIILYASIPLEGRNLSPEMKHIFETIISESHKGADLIQQILDFSSRAMIKRQPLNLVDFTADVLGILQRTIPESIDLKLETRPAGSDQAFIVDADASRLQQALTNLAINARDAMPSGGELRFVLSKLEIGTEETPPLFDIPPGDWICLTVSDTGIGMAEDVEPHIFEPFFTTKEVGEGVGLGLPQVHGIVRQHNGYIEVETEEGKGSAFHIYLPASDVEPVDAKEDVVETSLGQGEAILLVEDKEELREAGRNMLEALDYLVLTAANGLDALDICRAVNMDLVITDLVMPEMGGKELVQELRNTDPDLKALAITGYTTEGITEDLRSVGFLGVIQKPFAPGELARAVRSALDEE